MHADRFRLAFLHGQIDPSWHLSPSLCFRFSSSVIVSFSTLSGNRGFSSWSPFDFSRSLAVYRPRGLANVCSTSPLVSDHVVFDYFVSAVIRSKSGRAESGPRKVMSSSIVCAPGVAQRSTEHKCGGSLSVDGHKFSEAMHQLLAGLI